MTKPVKKEKPTSKKGNTVSRVEFAKIMGTTRRTVENWENSGMPSIRSGGGRGGNKINTAAAIRWWAKQRQEKLHPPESGGSSSIDAERLRLTTEQADEKALKNAADRAELIAHEYLSEFAMTTISNLDSAVEGMAARMAKAVANEGSPAKCRDLLKAEIDKARVLLSDSFIQLAEFNESRADAIDPETIE